MVNLFYLFNYLLISGLSHQEATQMTCLAFEESSLRPTAIHKNSNNTTDYGLFQINEVNIAACNTESKKLLTFEGNVSCAIKLYKEQGAEIWSTHRRCNGKTI